ncbi:MAG: DUF5011 domain-containing protein [Candidatus Hydrogenedens sp.]|nr:DUF5011 domain-containing protein [Candidatus Hydrogenedens sp.]
MTMRSMGVFILAALLAAGAAVAGETRDPLPLVFEPNQGQAPAGTDFIARGTGYTLTLSEGGATLASPGGVLRLNLEGANADPLPSGVDPLPGRVNYIKGRDASQWRFGIPTFERARYEAVYPGIDLVYYPNDGELEYDITLAPGVDPSDIRLRFEGHDSASISESGGLTLMLGGAAVFQHAPVSYQDVLGQRVPVESRYVTHEDGTFGFEVGAHDPAFPLVIDPLMTYGAIFSGSQSDQGVGLIVRSGNTPTFYTAGYTESSDLASPGATFGATGDRDIYVARVNSFALGKNTMEWLTIIGGSGTDTTNGMSMYQATEDHLFVCGTTSSADLPVTVNALDGTFNDGVSTASDGFVLALSADGATLEHLTYFGGSGDDQLADIDQSGGSVFVVGETGSTDLPLSVSAFSTTLTGSINVAFARLNFSLGSGDFTLGYSSYLGGDSARGIGVSAINGVRAAIVGQTSGGLTVKNAFQSTFGGGGFDAFVAAFDTNATFDAETLLTSSYLGDTGNDIALDCDANGGKVYIAGFTESATLPGNTGQTLAGSRDAFYAQVTPIDALTTATLNRVFLFGGDGADSARTIDAFGTSEFFIAGSTDSSTGLIPVSPTFQPFQETFGGGTNDGFLAHFDDPAPGVDLLNITYIGGSGNDVVNGVAADLQGRPYLTGVTSTAGFPLDNAFSEDFLGGQEAFVAQFNDVVFVDSAGLVGLPCGERWDTACGGLQNAMTAAENYDDVWMKAGTYFEDDVILDTGGGVYGGFAGSETKRGARDWVANAVNLDAGGASKMFGASTDSVIDGVRIFNTNGSEGAISLLSVSNVRIRNNFFRDLITSEEGAGVRVELGSNNVIANCIFVNNQANTGGAIYFTNGTGAIVNCSFYGNTATIAGNTLYNDSSIQSPEVTNCIVWGTGLDVPQIEQSIQQFTASHCIVENGYAGTSIQTADPLYVNATASIPLPEDFKVDAASPALNAGIDTVGATQGYLFDDFGQSERLVSGGGCTFDLGAWEAAVGAPSIALTGAGTVQVNFGDTYSDLGATATDGCGDDISGSLVVDDTAVNTSSIGDYTVTYDVTDFNGTAATQVTRLVQVVDGTAPVITLTGANPDTVECGSGGYTDPGATAVDDVDGTITGITGVGTVNVLAPGAYTLTYDVSDTAGNAATTVTRTVNVVDTTAPVITLNGANPETVECGGTYVDAGATATDTCDGTITPVAGGDTVDTVTPGTYVITYDAQDLASNAATQVTRTVNVVDTTNPTAVAQDITVQLNAAGVANITPAQIDNGSSDACDTVALTLDVLNFTCADLGANTVTLTASDGSFNQGTATATVTVEDNLAPTAVAQDITVQLDASGSATITAAQVDNGSSDNCGTPTLSLDVTAFDCTDIGANVVTLTATDGSTNTATATATVTVEDRIAPTAVAQDITVQLDATGKATITAAQIDNGSTDNCGTPTLSLDVASFDCSGVGTNTVTLTATDSSGNSSTATASVNVEDSIAPTAIAQDITVQLDATGNAILTPAQIDNGSADNCGTPVLSLDKTAFTCADKGDNGVTLTATDGAGNTAAATATVTVQDTLAPVFALNGDAAVTLTCGGTYTELGATATDNCDGDLSASVVIGGDTVVANTPGVYTLTYDIADASGNSATPLVRVVTVVDITGPAISLTGSAAVTVECGGTYTELGATASDGCAINLDGSIVIGGDTVDTTSPGTYVVTYDVSDGLGNAAPQVTRTVTVADTTAPVITLAGAASLTIDCGIPYVDAGATAADVCEGVLTGSITTTGAVDSNTPGVYTITYDAADSAANAAVQQTRTVTVADLTVPVLSLNGSPSVSIACGSVYTELGATALDSCEGDLTASVNVFGSVDTNTPGAYAVTYNVSDAAGNAAVQLSRTVNVTDSGAPVITLNGAADVTLECGSAYTELGATALDGCEGDLTASVVIGGDTVDTSTPDVYVVTYSAVDASGNAAAVLSRSITVADTTVPSLTLSGSASLTLNCGDTFSDPGATANDTCDGNLDASVAVSGAVDTDTPGAYVLTYSVSDGAGNAAASVTRTVTVLDNCVVTPGCDPDCEGQPLTDEDGDGLTACEEAYYGTSDTDTDSDGDGMPDSWEVQFCPDLDPADPTDRDANPDGDALTNIEEFLGQSDPTDPSSPDRIVYVAPPALGGVDAPGNGSAARPYATISFAIAQQARAEGEPVLLLLATGSYSETVVLQPGIKIKGADDGSSVIEGTVFGAEGCELIDVTISPRAGRTTLLVIDDMAMRIAGCVFLGKEGDRRSTGIALTGPRANDVVLDGCVFERLAVGIDVEAGLPIMRFCVMGDIPGAGIIVRCNDSEDHVVQVNGDDPRWGFNTFLPTVTGPAVINECPVEMNMERVDWGFDLPTPDNIDAAIDGDVNFMNFLALGGAVFSSSLFCTVWDAADQSPIVNATIRLLPSSAASVTRNTNGVYAFEAIGAGSYTLDVTAPGFTASTRPLLLEGGALESVTVALRSDGTNPEGEGEGPAEGEGEGEPGPPGQCGGCNQAQKEAAQGMASGDPLVAGLGLLALWSAARARRKR